MRNVVFDEAFERANARRFYLCVLAGIVASQCWPWGAYGLRIIAAVGGLVAGYGVAAMWERCTIWFRKCPRCGAHIGLPLTALGRLEKVMLPCQNCGVTWDLGIANPQRQHELDEGDRF